MKMLITKRFKHKHMHMRKNYRQSWMLCSIVQPHVVYCNRDLTQQDGWKTQNGRMPKKWRLRIETLRNRTAGRLRTAECRKNGA